MSLPTDRQEGDVIENEDINAIASEVNRISEALESDSGTLVGVPVFGSQAEAQAYEAENPGSLALWFSDAVEPDPNDETPPTLGTLSSSNITSTSFVLTVTGATDETALHTAPYAFTFDAGESWTPYQSSPSYQVTGQAPLTVMQCRHRVRDLNGNVTTSTTDLEVTTSTSAPGVTTFATDTVGSPPAGFTFPWGEPLESGWVYADALAVGGKSLRVYGGSSSPSNIAWAFTGSGLSAETSADVEILWKERGSDRPRGLLHGSGTLATRTGIYLIPNSGVVGGIVNGEVISGGIGTIPSMSYNSTSEWALWRVRIEDNVFYARTWLHGTPEPTDWRGSVPVPANLQAPGFLGLYKLSGGGASYADWISVAVGGDTAPNPEA